MLNEEKSRKAGNHLLFDFTVDKAAQTVFITKEFAAEPDAVWDAFTKPEILDQWWAPKPWISKTKYMNFEVGGKRFYAMCNPEGEPQGWVIWHLTAITPKTNFRFYNTFSDANENVNPEAGGSDWNLDFSETGARPHDPVGRGITTVNITIHNKSPERMELMLQMGFKEGFTSTLNFLERLLSK